MNETDTTLDLGTEAATKIKLGQRLIEITRKYAEIDGIQKLQRKVNQELKFLKKILKNQSIKKEHLQCSNLTHFSALIQTLSTLNGCCSISKVFMLDEKKITVDIICDQGLTWMKVIARNPKSISQICMGNASYGVRSVLDQALEYVECAKLYPCLFQTPKIVFLFANGVGNNLAGKIEKLGITVQGARLTDVDIQQDVEDDAQLTDTDTQISNEFEDGADLSSKNIGHIDKVNLDVSAMLAYVSSVTNGGAHLYDFCVHVLAQQAEWERQRPQKPILDNFFQGKKLYCCQTAKDNFVDILHTVGGPNEKIRGEQLLKRVTVLPDNATDLDATGQDLNDLKDVFGRVQFTPDKSLNIGGKIRQRSLTIFTFGDRIRAVTVTANDGFVRSARQQGIHFVVFVHESRALTEQKEQLKGTINS